MRLHSCWGKIHFEGRMEMLNDEVIGISADRVGNVNPPLYFCL